jgi:hypothetical protein
MDTSSAKLCLSTVLAVVNHYHVVVVVTSIVIVAINLKDNAKAIKTTQCSQKTPKLSQRATDILLNGIYHCTGPFQFYNTTLLKDIHAKAATTGILGRAPRHWRMLFEVGCCRHRRTTEYKTTACDDVNCCWNSPWNAWQHSALNIQSLLAGGHQEGCCCCTSVGANIDEDNKRTKQTPFVASIDNPSNDVETEKQIPPCLKEMDFVLLNASCLIGMHPDYPAGNIVLLALALNKLFAVVPCCIFFKTFPHRRLPCGTEVPTSEQFLDWIWAKDPLLQTAVHGRATVIYYNPKWKHAPQQPDQGQ